MKYDNGLVEIENFEDFKLIYGILDIDEKTALEIYKKITEKGDDKNE